MDFTRRNKERTPGAPSRVNELTCRKRLLLLVLAVVLLAAAVGWRLYQLQVQRSAGFRARAVSQHERRIVVHPARGLILDRDGHELAVSLETESLFAHPPRVEQPELAARLLAPILGLSRGEIHSRLRSGKPFVYLKRFLEPETAQRIRRLDLPLGENLPFGFLPESKRYYPKGRLGVHVIGYATIDGDGVEGIEKQFDEDLRGDPSLYLVTQDGRQSRSQRLVRGPERTPQDVTLTLDCVLQHIAERELERAMEDTGASAASAIIMEPRTGNVLALANRPAADPNSYGKARPEARVNRAVVHQYEPGSTFKPVPLAAVLEHDRIDLGRRFDCERGLYRLGSRVIRDVSARGWLTPAEVLKHSSNIGMVKITRTLQPQELWDVIDRFGFGKKTGIELPGEEAGSLRPIADWNAYSYASLAFGHEVAVTALQLVTAVAAIANDGVLVPPRVALGRSKPGSAIELFAPPAGRRVISRRSARELTAMLEGVIESGTGSRAALPGYRLAGKTGTAKKVASGGYSERDYIASFAGFGPAGSPRLVALVVLDSPRGPLHQGGHVAAPLFGRIMADALRHLHVPADEDLLQPPDVRASLALRAATAGRNRQRPIAGAVPDLQGLSLREAVSLLASLGYRVQVEGHGFVTGQDPAAGSPLERGGRCRLRLADAAWLAAGGKS